MNDGDSRDSARRLSRAALLAAAAVANGFLLFAVPNVELVTLTVAVSGLLLGPGWGFGVGVAGAGVFGALNPLGSSLAIPSLWAAQMLGQGLNGLVFGLLRARLASMSGPLRHALFAALGVTITALYQSLLALSFWLFAPAGEETFVAFLLGGLLFSLVHLISNGVIFGVLAPVAHDRLSRLPGFR